MTQTITIYLKEPLSVEDGMTALIYETSRVIPDVRLAHDRDRVELFAEQISYVVPLTDGSGREWNLFFRRLEDRVSSDLG